MRSIVGWALLGAFLAVVGLACGGNQPWPGVQSAGSGCIDPCGAMTCPAGTHCAWNGQCQPRCDTDPPPTGWKP
jgi:hypothetical protein